MKTSLFIGLIISGIFTFFSSIIGIILFKYRRDIDNMLNPWKYIWIEMMTKDNESICWLEKKPPEMEFEFNGGRYYLYDASVKLEKKEGSEQGDLKITFDVDDSEKVKSTVYKCGRNSKFYFNEGNSDPLDFRNVDCHRNANIEIQQTQIDLSRGLFPSDGFLPDDIGRWVILGGIAILIIIIVSMCTKQPPAVP